MNVAVVILNFNGAKLLKQFLPSVIEHTPSWCEIIVADNASTDNSLQVMKEYFPHIRIIPLSENTGFAGGYNRALKQVDAEYYVLLNSDIEVTPQWVEPVIQFMDANKDVAACQPKILAYHQKMSLNMQEPREDLWIIWVIRFAEEDYLTHLKKIQGSTTNQ